jgi:predicted ATPase
VPNIRKNLEMKVDIHVHTRKIKTGDAPTRNIEKEKFVEILSDTEVNILAITNHNHFDAKQYEEFRDGVESHCQIWPGIELDVFENGKRSHLIVICNPKNHQAFDKAVSEILDKKNPDTFTISLKETVEKFDTLDCIYIAHYFVKKPNLGDKEIEILIDLVSNPKRILKEATNSISAGIYISHGHNSIYGSDVQNWDNYIEQSHNLPELRLPVESFEQFCLLLEKDEATINTILDKKSKESIELFPFNSDPFEKIVLDIYSDINILFGSKGTGKTDILESLSKHYNSKGHKTSVYKSNDNHLNSVFDIKGNSFNCDASEFGLDECTDEIKFLKEVTEEKVTTLNKYDLHFSFQETNKISQKLKIKNITQADEAKSERILEEITDILDNFMVFKDYINENSDISKYIDVKLITELVGILEKILVQLKEGTEQNFIENKSIKLLNGIISCFNNEIAKKTNQPPKPTRTGFLEYSRNRIKIERASKKIIKIINQSINPIEKYAGSLGEKGELICKTNLFFQNGSFSNGDYTAVKNVYKTPQKEFANAIISISKYIHSNELFMKITELNEIENIITINSLSELLLKYKHFTLNGTIYSPSNGESSMILLHKELADDKDIYLIDEPEKSLGNDYINDVIVPLIKEKALLAKKVIIATHDANIAVRTLPYNSIYRLQDKGKGFTLTGNPFSNSLNCIYGSRPSLDWKEISMKTLEGGKAAFGERGKIYGN